MLGIAVALMLGSVADGPSAVTLVPGPERAEHFLDVSAVASPEPELPWTAGRVGWLVGSVWGSTINSALAGEVAGLGILAGIAPNANPRFSDAPGIALGLGCALGAIGGMVGGYYLGMLAGEGRLWAKILVVALDVLTLPAGLMGAVVTVAATGNFPGGG